MTHKGIRQVLRGIFDIFNTVGTVFLKGHILSVVEYYYVNKIESEH